MWSHCLHGVGLGGEGLPPGGGGGAGSKLDIQYVAW